jgi:hypothetical protein
MNARSNNNTAWRRKLNPHEGTDRSVSVSYSPRQICNQRSRIVRIQAKTGELRGIGGSFIGSSQ